MKKQTFWITAASAAVLTALSAVPAAASAAAEKEKTPSYKWSKDDEGRIYCTDANGDLFTGEQEIGGQYYLFSSTGVLRTGWRTVAGTRYYFSHETGKPQYGWFDYNGEKYYIDREDGKVSGPLIAEDGKGYFFDTAYGTLSHTEGITEYKGETYYVNEDGSLASGVVEVNGTPYVFSSDDFKELTGWQTVGEKTFYYKPEDGSIAEGFITVDDKDYYIDANEGRKTGAFTVGEKSYFADENGVLASGWAENGDAFFYYSPEDHTSQTGFFADGEYMCYTNAETGRKTKQFTLDGKHYMADEKGHLVTGWAFVVKSYFYFDPETYYTQTGFIADGENMCYTDCETGRKVGEFTLDEKSYYADENGALAKGWTKVGDKFFYYDPEDYTLRTGLMQTENGWSYSDAENGRYSGEFEMNGIPYLADENGIIQTGWQTVANTIHYYYEDLSVPKGVVEIDENYHLFSDKGEMLIGRRKYGDKKYYVGEDGCLMTGFVKLEDGTYYFSPEDFALVTGWLTLDGNKYFFDDSGKMLSGRVLVDGKKYYLNEEGIVQEGLITLADGTYLFGEGGVMQFGLQTIDGDIYYFIPSSGAMAINKSFEGYHFGKDGKGRKLNAVQIKANKILDENGRSINEIYNYVITHNGYKYIEETKTLAQIEAMGWSYFADYAMDNYNVVCYYFAAVTDILFQEAGYECRIVYGTGRGDSDHYWNQVKVDGKWLNYDTCNTYAGVEDIELTTPHHYPPGGYRDTGNGYTIKQYVYADYSDK